MPLKLKPPVGKAKISNIPTLPKINEVDGVSQLSTNLTVIIVSYQMYKIDPYASILDVVGTRRCAARWWIRLGHCGRDVCVQFSD